MKLFLAPPGHREDLQGAWTGGGPDDDKNEDEAPYFGRRNEFGAVSSSLNIANWVIFCYRSHLLRESGNSIEMSLNKEHYIPS